MSKRRPNKSGRHGGPTARLAAPGNVSRLDRGKRMTSHGISSAAHPAGSGDRRGRCIAWRITQPDMRAMATWRGGGSLRARPVAAVRAKFNRAFAPTYSSGCPISELTFSGVKWGER
jgi:hypothetical protein